MRVGKRILDADGKGPDGKRPSKRPDLVAMTQVRPFFLFRQNLGRHITSNWQIRRCKTLEYVCIQDHLDMWTCVTNLQVQLASTFSNSLSIKLAYGDLWIRSGFMSTCPLKKFIAPMVDKCRDHQVRQACVCYFTIPSHWLLRLVEAWLSFKTGVGNRFAGFGCWKWCS